MQWAGTRPSPSAVRRGQAAHRQGSELLWVFRSSSFASVSWGHLKANDLAKPNALQAGAEQIAVPTRKQLER